MQFRLIQSFLVTASLLLTAGLPGCGGGGGGGSASSPGGVSPVGTGSVGILLTDKPASLDIFSGVMMTVTRVELFNDDTGEKVTAYNGRPRGPFNLLRLRNESKPLTFNDNVPSGRYCKIRLTLEDMWLTFKDGSPDYHPRLPGNNKLDLNARDCFRVSEGRMIYVQLDMDMSKSIHIVQRGGRSEYNVRPVVFIDVIGDNFAGKLVRLEGGHVDAVDAVDRTLRVCDAIPMTREGGEASAQQCVSVQINRNTSVFDNDSNDGNATEGGDAIPLDEAFLPERVGRGPVTLVGYFRTDIDGVYAAHRKDHWKDDEDNDDNDDEYDDEYDDRHLKFDALVVEFGNFLNLAGEVVSETAAGSINVAPDATPTVSSATRPERQFQANDEIVEPGNGWAASEDVNTETAWIRLDLDSTRDIHRVVLYDVVGDSAQLEAGSIEFSNGRVVPIDTPLPDDGTPVAFDFDPIRTDWIQVNLTQAVNVYGLAEIEAYATVGSGDGFNMMVSPGQSYESDDPLPVVLQSAPAGGNGTKILDTDGTVLNAVKIGQQVIVDGVLSGPSPLFLNSALVFVDSDALKKDVAAGTINRVDSNSLLLEADAFICEPGTGPGFYEVNFTSGMDVYRLTESSSSFEGEFVGVGALEPGQAVDISGSCIGNSLSADTVVIQP